MDELIQHLADDHFTQVRYNLSMRDLLWMHCREHGVYAASAEFAQYANGKYGELDRITRDLRAQQPHGPSHEQRYIPL